MTKKPTFIVLGSNVVDLTSVLEDAPMIVRIGFRPGAFVSHLKHQPSDSPSQIAIPVVKILPDPLRQIFVIVDCKF